MATRNSILPASVQIVFEDKPLLRIREGHNDTTDYELNYHQLLAIAKQAIEAMQWHIGAGP